MTKEIDLSAYISRYLVDTDGLKSILESIDDAIFTDSMELERRVLKGAYRSLKKVRRTISTPAARFLIAATATNAGSATRNLWLIVSAMNELLPNLKQTFSASDLNEGQLQRLLIASRIWTHPQFDAGLCVSEKEFIGSIDPLLEKYITLKLATRE